MNWTLLKFDIECDDCGLMMLKGTTVLFNNNHKAVHPHNCIQKEASMDPAAMYPENPTGYLLCANKNHTSLAHQHGGKGPFFARTAMKREPVRLDPEPEKTFAEAAGEAADLLMRWGLAQTRRQNGLTVSDVALKMGWTPEEVVEMFESPDSDPTLGALRRYAMAVGAVMRREVLLELAEPEEEL